MARKAREISESGNYFVELNGNELFQTDADKERFIQIINEKFDSGRVYGVYLSSDVIRMAVNDGGMGISAVMKSVTTVYARYLNKATGRSGKLFNGRFKSVPIVNDNEAEKIASELENGIFKPVQTRQRKNTEPTKKIPQNARETPQKKTDTEKKKALPSWLL